MLENSKWKITFKKTAVGEQQDFFGQAARGEHAPLKPLQETYTPQQQSLLNTFNKHKGYFDEHIETSIPNFRKNSLGKMNAIVQSHPQNAKMLDIASSEGSLGKTITEASGGRIQTTNLDPQEQMIKTFNTKSQVPGAESISAAFGTSFEDEKGQTVPKFAPSHSYDVVHESMAFQFFGPEREEHIVEAKRLLAPDGIFLSEEKVRTDNEIENETQKDVWKAQYHTPEALQKKQKQVGFQGENTGGGGMMDKMVHQDILESLLKKYFKYVVQYWSSGNFKGYAASDSKDKIDAYINNYEFEPHDFETEQIPRSIDNPKISKWKIASAIKNLTPEYLNWIKKKVKYEGWMRGADQMYLNMAIPDEYDVSVEKERREQMQDPSFTIRQKEINPENDIKFIGLVGLLHSLAMIPIGQIDLNQLNEENLEYNPQDIQEIINAYSHGFWKGAINIENKMKQNPFLTRDDLGLEYKNNPHPYPGGEYKMSTHGQRALAIGDDAVETTFNAVPETHDPSEDEKTQIVDGKKKKWKMVRPKDHTQEDDSYVDPISGWGFYSKWKKVSVPPADKVKEFSKEFEQTETPQELKHKYPVRGHRWELDPTNLERLYTHDKWPLETPYYVQALSKEDLGRPRGVKSMDEWSSLMGEHHPPGERKAGTKSGAIFINPLLSPEAANEALWHELQHAYQHQEKRWQEHGNDYVNPLDLHNRGLSDEEIAEKIKQYYEHPMELDANEFADFMRKHPIIRESEPYYSPNWVPEEHRQNAQELIDQYYAEHGSKHRLRLPSLKNSKWKIAGETRTKLLERASQLPEDTSKIIHQFDDGWTIRELKTVGDHYREGQLMGNCVSNNVADHIDWDYLTNEYDQWLTPEEIEECENDGTTAEEMLEEIFLTDPSKYEKIIKEYAKDYRQEPAWKSVKYHSLRDENNLPHVSFGGGYALGRHNSEIKDEYKKYLDFFPKESSVMKEAPARSKAQFRYMQGICNGSIEPPEGMTRSQACEYVKGQDDYKDLPDKKSKWKKIGTGLWDSEPSRYFGTKVVEEIPINVAMQMLDFERGKEDYERENIDALVKHISENGFLNPIIIDFNVNDNTAYISEGNHRIQAAKQLGMEWIPARGMRNYGQKSSLKELPVKWQGTQTNHAGELYIPPDFPPHMIGIPVKEKVKGFEDGHYYNGWDVKESKLTPAQKLAKKKELESKLIDSGFSQKAASLISLQEISKQSYYLPGHRSAIALRDPETNDWHLDIAPHESFTHQGSMADYLRDLGSPSMRKFVKDEGPNEYYHRHLARGLYNPETREFVHMSHPEGIDEYDFEDPSKEKREVTEKFWQDLAERYDLPIEKIRFLNNYTGEYEDLNPDDIDIKNVDMPWEYKRELMKAIRNRPLNEHERQQGGYDTKTGSRYLYASKWKIAKEKVWEIILDGEEGHDIIGTGSFKECQKKTEKWLKNFINGYVNYETKDDAYPIPKDAKEQDKIALEELKKAEDSGRWSFYFDYDKPFDLIIQPFEKKKESKWKLSNVQFEIEGNHIYAIVNSKIVGDLEFINYDDDFDGDKIVEIEFIRVDKQHRRTGIGKLLLEKLYSLYPNHEFQTTGVTPLGEKLINSFERDSGKDVDYWGEASPEFPDEIPDKNSKWKIADHDYNPEWDYELEEDPQKIQQIQNIINQYLPKIQSYAKQKFDISTFQIHFVKNLEKGHVARYISGTSSDPVVVIDIDVLLNETENIQHLTYEIQTTIIHELAHAYEEKNELEHNEDFAEDKGQSFHFGKWKIAAKKKIHHKHYSDLRSHQKAVKHYGPLKTHNVKNFKKKSVLNENQAQELFGQDPYMYHDVAAARTKNGQNEQVTTIGSILKNGILPKEQTGVSEYSDWLTSRPHHAYVGKETFYPKSRVPALRIDMSKVDPSTLAPDEDLFPSFGYSNQLSHLIDFHNVKNPPFEREHPEGATLGQWAHEHSHLDTPKNVKASKDLIGAIAVKGGVPSDAIHFNPKWLDEVEYKVRFNLEDPEADLESDRYLMELILSNEDRIPNDEWDYIYPIMELYNELVAEIKRRREMKHSKWKIADYQGWTNYETWNVNTTMVSDYELNKHFHNLVVNGASGNQFIADAIGMVIGPHNKQLQEDFSSMTDDEEVEMMKKNQEEDWWRNAEKHHPDNYLAQEDYVRKMKDITMTFMGEPEPSDIANYWIDESKVNWNEIYNYWKRNAEAEGNQIISKWKIC